MILSRKNLLDTLAIFVSGLTTLIILLLIYMLTWPITVLEDWKLVVPATTYHPGDTVLVQSRSTKVRAVAPLAHRNIECQNISGDYISYHLADVHGVNNNVGKHSGTIAFIIPSTVPDLPTTCRFSIGVEYQVLAIRTINQYVASNTFRLTVAPVATTSTQATPVPQTNTSSQTASQQFNSTTSTSTRPLEPAGTSSNTPPVQTCTVSLLFIQLGCNDAK